MSRLFISVFILLLAARLYANEDYNQRQFLFCLKKDRPSLNFDYVNGSQTTSYPAINRVLKKYGVISVERWLPGADERDVVGDIDLRKIYQVTLAVPKNMDELAVILNDFRGLDEIHSAEAEAINHITGSIATLTPDDAYLSRQWYINKIQTNLAWPLWGDSIPGDPDVLVGVVDTGVDYTHPDLASALYINPGEDINHDGLFTDADKNKKDDDANGYTDDVRGWDFAASDADIRPPQAGTYQELSHGTHVAGIMAATANNGSGIAGISFRSRIIGTKHAADDDLTEPAIIKGYTGVLYCAKLGAKIINCSWGGGYDFYGKSVIENVTKNYGAIVVCAAGNENQNNDNNHHYPSDFDSSFAVAATNINDNRTYYSNYGNVIDISAPGGEGSAYSNAIYSTIHENAGSYAAWQGTSMASPVAAGALALLKAWFPDKSRVWLMKTLKVTADPLNETNPEYKDKLGAGRVNVYNAIASSLYPKLLLAHARWTEASADADSQVNPGETLQFNVMLKNSAGWQKASLIQVKISSASAFIELIDSTAAYGDVAGGDSLSNGDDELIIKINSQALYQPLSLTITVSANETSAYPYTAGFEVEIPVTSYQKGYPLSNTAIRAPLGIGRLFDNKNKIVAVTGDRLLVVDKSGATALSHTIGNATMAPVIADMDGNGYNDIVVMNRSGQIYYFMIDPSGYRLKKFITGEMVYGDAAAANMDDDAALELVFGTMNKKLHVVKLDSSEVAGFPLATSNLVNEGVALADLTADGVPEIIFGASDAKLHILTATGDTLPNFPITMTSRVTQAPLVVQTGDSLRIVLVTMNNDLLIYDLQGTLRGNYSAGSSAITLPAIADLNNDNRPDIVFGQADGAIQALDLNGRTLENFPVMLNGDVTASPVIADINGDHQVEIIAGTEKASLYIISADGQMYPGFPARLSGNLNVAPALATLDEDSDLEIAFGSTDALHVLSVVTGDTIVTDWPTYLGNNRRTGFAGDIITAIGKKADAAMPDHFTLRQNYPNPFNATTRISFTVPPSASGKPLRLAVYDLSGRLVQTLVNEKLAAGHHAVTWNGLNLSNSAVASGIYFCQLRSAEVTITKRMLLIK